MMRVYTFLLLFCITPCSLHAVVIGSQTAISRQAQVTFPYSDNDNEARGFAAFEYGFNLENNLTSCIFNSVFPVGGSMQLFGGTLSLSQDLVLEGNTVFNTFGTINGNNMWVRFTKAQQISLPATASTSLSFITSAATVNTINSVDWSYDNKYLAVGLNTGSGNEVRVFSFNGSTLTQVATYGTWDGGGGYPVASVRWHPSAYYIQASLAVDDTVANDTYCLAFNSGTNALTELNGALLTGGGQAIAWHSSGNYLIITSNYTGAEIRLYSFSTSSGIASVQLLGTTPDSVTSGDAMAWNSAGTYFAVGAQQAASVNTLAVYSFNGSNTIALAAGAQIGQTVEALDWNPTYTSYIAIGLSTGGTETIRLYQFNSPSTLVEKTSARVGETQIVNAMQWSPDGTKLLVGLQTGTGTEFRVYTFNATTLTLTFAYGLDLANNVNALRWSRGTGLYVARADNTTNVLNIYGTVVPSSNVIFNNTKLIFEADVTVNAPLKFQGVCEVYGNGRTIDCTSGSIIVDSGANILLDNVVLKGISTSSGNLVCMDTLGTVTLRNSTWKFDQAYSFTQGRLDITGDVLMTGTQTFTYQSSKPCTIASNVTWQFAPGMTLRYAPTSGNSLLSMTDQTSVLYFNDATLSVSTAGLQLTKGKIKVEGTCPLVSNAVSQAQGIYFGDGASGANDVLIQPLALSGFVLQSGFCTYNNILG